MPFLSINTRELYYVWNVPVDRLNGALTFLLIHGLGSSSSFYAPVIPRLVEQGFSCLAFDTYGSCLSKYTGQKQDIQTIASDAGALLDALGISSNMVIAVGHSMGGLVVSSLAAQRDIAGAVLIGPVSPSPAVSTAFTQRIRTVEQSGMESMANSIPVAATGTNSTSTHHAFIRALLLSQDPQGYISLCQAISSAVPPDYSHVRCPALFVAGQDDKVAPLEGVEKEMQSWSHGTLSVSLKTLEGVGHWHCIEAADDVSSLLLEFAGQLR